MNGLFYTYETALPDNVGFTLFEHDHIYWLLGIFAFTLVMILLHKNLKERSRRSLNRIMGSVIVLLIIVRTVYVLRSGAALIYELPLHLCSLAGIICLIYALKPLDFFGQVLYTMCLPGAIAALLFPDWTAYPAISFMSIEAFVYHGLVVAFILCQVFSKDLVPSFRKIWKVFAFCAVAVPPVYLFNRHFHTNYMFLEVPSDESVLVLLTDVVGPSGYFYAYAALAVCVFFFMDFVYNLAKP